LAGGSAEEAAAWLGTRPNAMLPSGEYFLGRPLFFFEDSEEPTPSAHGFSAASHVLLLLMSLRGSGGGGGGGGGGLWLWWWWLVLMKGNRAVAGANMEG